MPNPNSRTFYKNDHDHQACVSTALSVAISICDKQDVRFTPIRKKILELIWSSHKPVLAYDLLKSLRTDKSNAEPPTVYRALDFLMQQNLIHKIESLNAYVGCHFPEQTHIGQFLICSNCNQCAELTNSSINQAVSREARKNGFKVDRQTVEITGLCPQCQPKGC